MTRRKSSKAPTSRRRTASKSQSPTTTRKWYSQGEGWGLALTTIGLVTTIALIAPSYGKLSQWWSLTLRRIFGVGAYPVALLMIAGGILLLLRNSLQKSFSFRSKTIVGWELVFFAGLGMLHILTDELPLELAQAVQRGGYIGWTLWQLLVPILGKPISTLILAAFWAFGVYLATGEYWQIVLWHLRKAWAKPAMGLKKWLLARQRELASRVAAPPTISTRQSTQAEKP